MALTLYAIDRDTDTLCTVDTTTGVATALPNPFGVTDMEGLASQGGVLYGVGGAVGGSFGRLYTIDPITGVATNVGRLFFSGPGGLASHSDILYAVRGGASSELYTVNPGSGFATEINDDIGIDTADSLTSHEGVLYAASSFDSILYTVDPTTGVATALPNSLGF